MSEKKKQQHKNPFQHFLDLAAGGLLSSASGEELNIDPSTISEEDSEDTDSPTNGKKIKLPENSSEKKAS